MNVSGEGGASARSWPRKEKLPPRRRYMCVAGSQRDLLVDDRREVAVEREHERSSSGEVVDRG